MGLVDRPTPHNTNSKLVLLSEKLDCNLCLHTKTFMGGDDKVVISK